MTWVPTTEAEQQDMLETIGLATVEDLFEVIPPELRTFPDSAVPAGMSELGVRRHLSALAGDNDVGCVGFLGAGYYDHYIPAAIDALTSRGEFYTAYTPYQAECAQGTLQSIYEYQSAICRLTEMEFANASLYDGGTAVFEATTMAVRITKRRRIFCHSSVNPLYRRMLQTHVLNLDLELIELEGDQPVNPADGACVLVQNPSFLGTIWDYSSLAKECHRVGALLVAVFYPVSLGLLKTPGEMGADTAVAEGQSLGIPLGFGGPYLGVMATRKEHLRKMPGRISAATADSQGRRGFVLTLQTREQHIRREKATSNICSNEALCALRALLYLCLLGKEGLRDVASLCHAKAEYLKGQLASLGQVINDGPTFNEFVLRLPYDAQEVVERMVARGFLAGLPLSLLGVGQPNDLLVAVTEKRTRDELDRFAAALADELRRH